MNDSDNGVITVEIFGHRYPIRSKLDPSYVEELARYVDIKMQTAAERSEAADSIHTAILAALNIADDFYRCRDAKSESGGGIRRRAMEIEAVVDRAISVSGPLD